MTLKQLEATSFSCCASFKKWETLWLREKGGEAHMRLFVFYELAVNSELPLNVLTDSLTSNESGACHIKAKVVTTVCLYQTARVGLNVGI